MADSKEIIARRAALELKDGDIANLGIGIPSLVVNYLPGGIDVTFHSENGCLGIGPLANKNEIDADLSNASSNFATFLPGASFFDSATSFALVRGGHISIVMLGAMEVDEEGSIANWKVPGKKVAGMGGAMDLLSGAKRVVVTMLHKQKNVPKILKKCTLPLTAKHKVNTIITEMAVMEVTPHGLILKETGPGCTVEDVINNTEATLIIPEKVEHFGE